MPLPGGRVGSRDRNLMHRIAWIVGLFALAMIMLPRLLLFPEPISAVRDDRDGAALEDPRERSALERQRPVPARETIVTPSIEPEASEDPGEALPQDPSRFEVLDGRGNPLPAAVAVHEQRDGQRIGFAADGRGWIAVPAAVPAEAVTVYAAGFQPVPGVVGVERVVLAESIRVEVEVVGGWQRLNEGWAGVDFEDGIQAVLEPPRDPGADLFEEGPIVTVRSEDGSTEPVPLSALAGRLHSDVSPTGLATFWVSEPGRYDMKVKFTLQSSLDPDTRGNLEVAADSTVEVLPDMTDPYFRVDLYSDVLDMLPGFLSEILKDR